MTSFRKLLGLPRFMLDHRWTKAHLSDEIDGRLDPEEQGRLGRHVRDCKSCRRLLNSLRRTVGALRKVTPRPGPGVADRTIERLDGSPVDANGTGDERGP